MSAIEEREIFRTVDSLLGECGIEGEYLLDAEQYAVCFGLPKDRTQEVFISDSTAEPELSVITLHSVCLEVEKGFFKGISKNDALELLTLNGTLNFARYGIQSEEDKDVIVATCDLFLEGLSPRQLQAALECVALAADGYEELFGQDIH